MRRFSGRTGIPHGGRHLVRARGRYVGNALAVTMGRSDTATNLYESNNKSTPYRQAFWHQGVGMYQLDSTGVGKPYNAAQRVSSHLLAGDSHGWSGGVSRTWRGRDRAEQPPPAPPLPPPPTPDMERMEDGDDLEPGRPYAFTHWAHYGIDALMAELDGSGWLLDEPGVRWTRRAPADTTALEAASRARSGQKLPDVALAAMACRLPVPFRGSSVGRALAC